MFSAKGLMIQLEVWVTKHQGVTGLGKDMEGSDHGLCWGKISAFA